MTFQSTHSITECDTLAHAGERPAPHFNPRTPLQSATSCLRGTWKTCTFQSNQSITESEPTTGDLALKNGYFNPRTPLQSATGSVSDETLSKPPISIHALHYRVRQGMHPAIISRQDWISIHALHYRVRPQHIVVYSAILLVAAKNFCAIQVQ